MNNSAVVIRLSTLAFAVSSAMLSLAARAEDDAVQVIVTGRAIGRTDVNSAVPIDVLSREDIARAIASSGDLGSALQSLLPSFTFPHQSNSGGADHVRAAQLRGMSPDQVLVLINGKRQHTSAMINTESATGRGTNPVDFNSIPANAIKRIEVLRDGAGAQYGSDAVGGVVNIILDDAPEGGSVSVTGGGFHSKFAPTEQTINDGGNVDLQASNGWRLGDNGFVRAGLDLNKRNPTNRAGAGDLPFFENQSPVNLALAGKRVFKVGDAAQENANLWLNAQLALDANTKAYGFVTYNHRHSVGDAFFRYPDSSANVTAIYPQGFVPQSIGNNQDLSLNGGIKGKLGSDWDFDASLTYGENRFRYGLEHSLNSSLGVTSPSSFNLGEFRFAQTTANLDLTRELQLGGQIVNLATGAELRNETYRTSAGDPASYAVGSNADGIGGSQGDTGIQPGDTVSTRRNVAGLYVDLSAELSKKLFAEASARFDHYDDFGSAATGKFNARYEVTPTVAVRGAVSSNFRAPSLAQNSFSFTVTDFGQGGALSQVRTLPVNNPVAKALGAQPLNPEKSVNYSLGLTARPIAGLTASLDLFQIDVKDRITLSQQINGDTLSALLQTRFGISDINGINFFTNAVDTRTRGADLVIAWSQPFAGGTLVISDASSFVRNTLRKVHAQPAELAALGLDDVLIGATERNTLTTLAPTRRDVLSVNWSNALWSTLLRTTRHGETTRVLDFGGGYTPTQTYRAVYQFDMELEYKLSKQLSLSVGGLNLTNQYPSRSIDDISYFGHLPYDFVSPIGLNGAYFYARARYSF
jgi:iron complex outermembrane receptor protein